MILLSYFSPDALYKVNVSSIFGKENNVMIDDILRMLIIQCTIQMMFYLSSPERGFFTADFILLVIYITLGVALYWLVFRKIVVFV